MLGENLPLSLAEITDPRRRDEVMTQYGELRRHLFDVHLKRLTDGQRELLASGRHPSQDHALTGEAASYAKALRQMLEHLPCVKDVGVGNYHGNRNVLEVFVSGIELLDPRLLEIPDFYEGFEVLVLKTVKQTQ